MKRVPIQPPSRTCAAICRGTAIRPGASRTTYLPPEPTREAARRLGDLVGRAGEAQAQIALAAGTESRARRHADARPRRRGAARARANPVRPRSRRRDRRRPPAARSARGRSRRGRRQTMSRLEACGRELIGEEGFALARARRSPRAERRPARPKWCIGSRFSIVGPKRRRRLQPADPPTRHRPVLRQGLHEQDLVVAAA